MISNCGHDENGKYSGGTAGDQTGTEWQVISWYNRPWNVVLRFEDQSVAEKIAELARKAAQNNLIGYDQGQRGTYWQHLKASNYDPSQITIACEADCSSGVAANVKAVGHLLNIKKLKDVSSDCYTGNLRSALKAAGAKELTDSKYLTSDAYLLPGDILLYEGHHTATNLDVGSKASWGTSGSSSSASNATFSGNTIVRDGQMHANNFVGAGLNPDGIRGELTKKAGIMVLQQGMNLDYESGLEVDGIWGTKSETALADHYVKYGETQYMVTACEILLMLKGVNPNGVECPGEFGSGLEAAVREYQSKNGLKVDGICGRETFKSLIA